MRKMREWHRWVSAAIFIPLALTTLTGVFLLHRSKLDFIRPKRPAVQRVEIKNVATISKVVSQTMKTFPDLSIHEIAQIRYLPTKGYFLVKTKKSHELILHGESLEVLSKGLERTSLLVRLHEGTFFAPWVRDFVFFPSALGMVFLLFSGIILFYRISIKPKLKKRMR